MDNLRKRLFKLNTSHNYSQDYLTLEAIDNCSFNLNNYENGTIKYSVDEGENWITYTDQTINISSGDKLLIKGTRSSSITDVNNLDNTNKFVTSTGRYIASGNILSLYYEDEFEEVTSIAYQYAFAKLFYNDTYLVNAANLVLRATTLANYCYMYMFNGCTSLTEGPKLPATSVSQGAYKNMFSECTNLLTAPELPATTLAEECYQYMFLGASSLTTAPTLSATSLAKNCYNDMFKNCTSLTTIQNTLPATSLKTRCYCGMFVGCTALTRVSSTLLPATTMADSCYQGIFSDCTSLITAPTFTVATTVNQCCKHMFKNCSLLTSISCSLNASQAKSKCYEGMFSSCTLLTTVPTLPATTLESGCYQSMFQDCTSLITAPALPATTLASNCYQSMFQGCTSLTTAPTLPATTLAGSCYNSMFMSCTSLTTAPDLLADTVVTQCYLAMFLGCSNLNYLKCMFKEVSTGASAYRYNILWGVANSGTLIRNVNTEWALGDHGGPPIGWTIVDEGAMQPTISFDGEDITLECATTGATIYYQLNNNGNYIEYTGTISISSDTIIRAYAELNGYTSTTLLYSCIYSPNTLLDPTITFNYGTTIVLTCLTPNSVIYYRLNNTGSFIQYTEPIIINATTFIEAYSELNGSTSNTVSETFTFINYNEIYFTIESLADNNTISIVKAKSPNNINLSYSTDDGETWTNLTISATTIFTTINTGDKIIFKGINIRLATAWDTYYRFNGTKNFKAYGNIMSLLNGDNFINTSELDSSTTNHFAGLFYGTTTLIDADKLVLSASTLYNNSYNGMFRGCTNLKYAPKLQATTPGQECCSSMFEGCINLETVPEINFTTLVQGCCKRMFCMNRNSRVTTPKMTKSPILRCATGASKCYEEMFKGNGNLIQVTCLLTNDSNACENWLTNVSSIGTFRKSPLKTNWPTSVSGIPSGWTVEDYVEE